MKFLKKYKFFIISIASMLIIAGIIIGVILSITNNSGKYGYYVALYSGDILYDSFWAEKGEKIELPDNLVKEGYIFDGWYYDKDVWRQKFDPDTPIEKSITLYAYWKKRPPLGDNVMGRVVGGLFASGGDYKAFPIGSEVTVIANVPATPFAYGTTEYSGCTFIYDIRFEMHEIPMKEHNYAVGTQTVIGFSNNPAYCLPAYDGQKGLTIDTTYIFNRTIALTPSATKTIKATIDSVTIVHADGSIEYLSGSQIRDNFTLRFRYGNNVYEPYSSTMLPQRNNYFYRELSVFQNEWLEIPKDMASSLSVDIVYQDESDYARLLEGQSFTPSAFAFNASKYASASFYFEIKIEMVDTPW